MNPADPAHASPAERILAAADRLFYHHGIRAVGVDAVAAKAGVSKRTLYNYYASKDDLIAAGAKWRLSCCTLSREASPCQRSIRASACKAYSPKRPAGDDRRRSQSRPQLNPRFPCQRPHPIRHPH